MSTSLLFPYVRGSAAWSRRLCHTWVERACLPVVTDTGHTWNTRGWHACQKWFLWWRRAASKEMLLPQVCMYVHVCVCVCVWYIYIVCVCRVHYYSVKCVCAYNSRINNECGCVCIIMGCTVQRYKYYWCFLRTIDNHRICWNIHGRLYLVNNLFSRF